MKSYTFNCSPHSVASLLLTLLISSSAYANSYSAGNGQALGTNSTAIGQDSYATSTNGVAIGHNAIATGGGMSRKQFAERREAVAEIERQIGEKQKEISTIDAQLYSIQSLIDGIELRIADINQRQIAVARLLEQRAALQKQRETIENNLSDQQNQLTQANDAYNRVSKDSRGDSLYSDFDKVLRTLDWSQLNQANGRETLTTVLKNKIENEFTDLAGQYTEQQYRALIDGFVNRQQGATISSAYLHKLMDDEYFSHLKLPEDPIELVDKYLGIISGSSWLLPDFYSGVPLDMVNKLEKMMQQPAGSNYFDKFYISDPEENYGHGLIEDLYIVLSYKKDGSLVNKMVSEMYDFVGYSIDDGARGSLFLLPPVKEGMGVGRETFNSILFAYHTHDHTKSDVQRALYNLGSGGFSASDIDRLKSYIRKFEDYYGKIDFENNDWFFDLSGYKERWDKVKAYNEKIKSYIDSLEQLKVEQSKPLSEQDDQLIDRLNSEIIISKKIILDGRDDGNNFSWGLIENLTVNKDVVEREFSEYLPKIQEVYNQVDKRIRTYDSTDPIVTATKAKSAELKQAITEAQNKVNRTQNDINQLIEQIARLGLSPDDETLADRKREQEQLLNQRQGELALQRQELVGKQTELEQLNKNLANSSIANIGENSIAEGANAFASGKNAIADGVNALAIGENAIAQGNNAQALGKDSTAQGTNAVAAKENATATGANAQALGKNSTAQGANAVAAKENTTATGANAQALGKNSTAQGANAVAKAENATATGVNAQALGKNSTAQGANAVAKEENATATGANAQALGKNSTAQGANAVAKAENATATGANAQALGKNSTAQGANAAAKEENATATGANAQALGKDSIALGNNAVSAEQRAMALGINTQALGSASTVLGNEAVATKENATALGQNAAALASGSVALGQGSLATAENEVSVGNEVTGLKRKINNVSNGLISDTSSEAVTGQQLYGVAQILGAVVTSNGLLDAEFEYYEQGDAKKTKNVKTAIKAVSQNNRYASVNSIGNAASAKGNESVAIGGNSAALGANSVAMGSGSVALSDNEFSVGNSQVGLSRRITNVADGVADNDAATVGQLNRGIAGVESKLQKAEKRLSGGVAGAYAAASLVNASLAGDNMLSVGTGTYNGSTALAVGYSKVSDNGKIHLKLLGSANNQGEVGGGASVGFKFK